MVFSIIMFVAVQFRMYTQTLAGKLIVTKKYVSRRSPGLCMPKSNDTGRVNCRTVGDFVPTPPISKKHSTGRGLFCRSNEPTCSPYRLRVGPGDFPIARNDTNIYRIVRPVFRPPVSISIFGRPTYAFSLSMVSRKIGDPLDDDLFPSTIPYN